VETSDGVILRVPWQVQYVLIASQVLMSAVSTGMLTIALLCQYPALPVTFPSLIPEVETYSKWIHLLLSLPTAIFVSASYITTSFMAQIIFLQTYVLNFLLGEMR
jgi:hypothetical protein